MLFFLFKKEQDKMSGLATKRDFTQLDKMSGGPIYGWDILSAFEDPPRKVGLGKPPLPATCQLS